MLKKVFVFLFVTGVISAAGAQEKNKVVIVAGRMLNSGDSSNVKKDFYSGLEKKTVGNLDQAARLFANVIETDPQNDAALYELGSLSHAQNKESAAEEFARKAVTVNPDNKWYWLLLSDIYKKTSNFDQLVLVFDELIRLDPDKDNYYYDKANALSLLNENERAKTVYQEIETRFGASPELDEARQRLIRKEEDPEAALVRLKEALKKNPKDINNYLSLSEVYIKMGQHEKAYPLLIEASKKDPDNSFVHLLLSDTYQASGKTSEAFSEIKKAFSDKRLPIDIKVQVVLSYFSKLKEPGMLTGATELASITAQTHPSEAKAQALYGDILFQGQKLEEAKQAYKKALALNQKVYLIWAQLLQVEVALNSFDEAIDDGERAISLFPAEPDLYFFIAIAYDQKKDHLKAVDRLEKAISLNPKKWIPESDIYSNLANSLNSLKKYEESDEAFEKSLELNPDNVYTLNNYAYYLSVRGVKLEKAAGMSRRCNELRPGNASFEDTYAWVLFKQRKYPEAKIWIEKAIKNNSNTALQYEHYGDILYRLGDTEQAIHQWKKAKENGIKSETLEKKINEKKLFE